MISRDKHNTLCCIPIQDAANRILGVERKMQYRYIVFYCATIQWRYIVSSELELALFGTRSGPKTYWLLAKPFKICWCKRFANFCRKMNQPWKTRGSHFRHTKKNIWREPIFGAMKGFNLITSNGFQGLPEDSIQDTIQCIVSRYNTAKA